MDAGLYSQEHIPRNSCKSTVALSGYLNCLFLWGLLLFSHPMVPFSSILFLIPGVEAKNAPARNHIKTLHFSLTGCCGER